MLIHMLRKFDPRRYPGIDTVKASDERLSIRYLGTAGFVLEGAQTTLALDPFVSRPSLLQTALGPLHPNEALIQREIPACDGVLVGHAHHDHILDAPALCKQTGAVLVGSPAVANVGRAAGLPPEQLIETEGRELIDIGGAKVTGLPSRHGRVYFNRVTLPGDIPEPPPWPARFWHLRHGLVLNWHVELNERRIVHIDSADFIEEELDGQHADVLCLCAIGRRYRPHYVERAVKLTKARLVVACHWDWLFTPFDATPRELPGVELENFVREIEATGAQAVVPGFGARFSI